MSNILLFIIPPVMGAIIGYVTNAIAIKMLFRPLKEIRIFGIRLPFTPGILPRQRARLAQSIGGMVERELITAEIIRSRLSRDDVGGKIGESIEGAYPILFSAVSEFLRHDDIRREMESKGRIILRNIFQKMNTFQRFFVSAGQYDMTLEQKMPEVIEDLIVNIEKTLNSDNIKKKLTNTASTSIKNITSSEGIIENLLKTINVKALVADRIDSLDMLRVERIILDVMSDQFKWINIFGGILGFLIGLFQVAFSYFLR